MVDFRHVPESKNFEDRTGAPWYDPNKLLGNIMVAMSRVVDVGGKQKKLDEVQRQRDANPLPKFDFNANKNTRVKRVVRNDPMYENTGGGYTIQRPGAIVDEYVPSYIEPKAAKIPTDTEYQAAIRDLLRRGRR